MTDRPRTRRPAPRQQTLPHLDLALRIQARRWRELPDLRALVEAAIAAGLGVAPIKPPAHAELSLLMTDDRRIRIVNRDWRGFDKATKALSFPAVPPERIAQSPVVGDIVLALETVEREAEAEAKSVADHLSHLVIHGLLHLLGEDHETTEQAERMESLEIAALATLGIADPYADSEPATTTPDRPSAP